MTTSIVWFRRDLRLLDNPALQAALAQGHTPIPVYIHDDTQTNVSNNTASAWWLHHSLTSLQKDLRQRGSDLLILRGNTQKRLTRFIQESGVRNVFYNRLYEPEAISLEKQLNAQLVKQGASLHTFNASLLREPWDSVKSDGTPYRVFTPFWKRMLQQEPGLLPITSITDLPPLPAKLHKLDNTSIESLQLLPTLPWYQEFHNHWKPGEQGAQKNLQGFIQSALAVYPMERDIPALTSTSRLSPHLHFGEINPLRIWQQVRHVMNHSRKKGSVQAGESFLRQLAWREFAFHLLFHFPHTTQLPLDERFRRFPWRKNYRNDLQRWQKGITGIPMIDAGMRELWATGYMHNRVRMLVASLLTKNLLIPWQEGAHWFMDTLLDADIANNTLGWQWTAGCGADAAPYFRIFNPVTQGTRFDPDGNYVRQWIPEIASLPAKWIHHPWEAPAAVCAKSGFTPGEDYPLPIVDLAESRRRALEIWNRIK